MFRAVRGSEVEQETSLNSYAIVIFEGGGGRGRESIGGKLDDAPH